MPYPLKMALMKSFQRLRLAKKQMPQAIATR